MLETSACRDASAGGLNGNPCFAKGIFKKHVDNPRLIVHDLFVSCVWYPMLLVHNERTKLTASWLNTIATALMAAGAFAPAAAWLYGLSSLPIGALNLTTVAVACIAGGAGLHISGLAVLGRLRE